MNPTAPQSEPTPTLNFRSQAAMTPAKRRRLVADDERVLAEHAGVRRGSNEEGR